MSNLIVHIIGLAALIGGPALVLAWITALVRRELRDELSGERGALDAEWRALEQARRVGDVFYAARTALQQEAQRQYVQPPRRR